MVGCTLRNSLETRSEHSPSPDSDQILLSLCKLIYKTPHRVRCSADRDPIEGREPRTYWGGKRSHRVQALGEYTEGVLLAGVLSADELC